MSRALNRSTAALAVAATFVLAGCGGSSSGGADASENPKAALVAGVVDLSSADTLTTTLQLETSADDLQQLAEASGDTLSDDAADAISSAELVIEKADDKTASVRAVVNDNTLFELRTVDETIYLQGDLQSAFDLANNPNGLDDVKAQAAQLPDFVQAFINGEWVSVSSTALQSLAGSLGVTPQASPSANEGPKLLSALRRAIESDITVVSKGEDSDGEHVQLSGETRDLAADLQDAIKEAVPGGGALTDRLGTTDTTDSRTITVDAWLNDGALSKLSLDLAQFDDKNELPDGTSLPLVLTFEESGDAIDAPSDATPIDLSQLGPLLGAFGGGATGSA